MSTLIANLGLFTLKWENPEYLTNLGNTAIWDKCITETNNLIGKETSLRIDNIYAEGMGASNYILKEGGKSVVITKNPILIGGDNSEWWMPKVKTPESMWLFLMTADADIKIKAGQRLKVKFHENLIPLEDMYQEVWWMNNHESVTPALGTNNLSKIAIKKIIDNIVKKHYVTLISRIANN